MSEQYFGISELHTTENVSIECFVRGRHTSTSLNEPKQNIALQIPWHIPEKFFKQFRQKVHVSGYSIQEVFSNSQ